jgi:CheY-like chemotaxis protein
VEEVDRKKVLIVDDNSLNAKLLKTMMRQIGSFDIHLVESASEALFFYFKEDYDAIFLDIIMPIIDGEAFLKAIEQLSLKKLIPMRQNIILCTSIDSIEMLNNLSAYPQVSGLLQKPVSAGSLHKEIVSCLDKAEGA